MDLIEGIKSIIDGNAVIIMGAGASYGARNAFGEFPSGSKLAKELYEKCQIEPDDPNDLQDAAQCFEEKYSAEALISEIRLQLNCASFTHAHEIIYTLPWMRYYTTNYDDVALLAAKKHGKVLTPVTLKSDLRSSLEAENLCVHINGYIGKLNENALHHEFKLTSISYLSQTNILNSQWGALFQNDLQTARCIVILGLSLTYDLDLNKIIYNSHLSDKTIIINSPKLSTGSERKLSRYGNVFKIGIDKFAEEIENIKKQYSPQKRMPSERLYTAFTYEYHKEYGFQETSSEDVFRLLINGQYRDSIFYKNDGEYLAFIERKESEEMIKNILDGKKFLFIHSDMGNGKTACLNELKFRLSKYDIHMFTLNNADSTMLNEEIKWIIELAENSKVLIIVDDYTNFMEVMKKFSLQDSGKLQYILTARTALNHNKFPVILNKFHVQPKDSAMYDLNKLSGKDIEQCIRVFDRYGLFGQQAGCSYVDKKKYLESRQGGGGKFQSILLEVIQSDVIKNKVKETVEKIKNGAKEYYNAVILILLVEIMKLRLSTEDIERISDVDLTTDALFKSDASIKELVSFDGKNEVKIKSPVMARYILGKVSDPRMIISSLASLAVYAERYSKMPKYRNLLTTIISYSHIHSFLRNFQDPKQFLMEYYDELSKMEYYRFNNFFWLQYAIACIETHKFERAQKYLDTAYGLISEGFTPFQINNQQARLYLERILNEETLDPVDDFCKAHKILMLPIASIKDNEYNIVRLFGYYCKKKIYTILKKHNAKIYESACEEAIKRLERFVKNNLMYAEELNSIKMDLLKAKFDNEF